MKAKTTNAARTSSQIREELEEKREIAARLPVEIERATREHATALEEFDRERGLEALDRKRRASIDLEAAQSEIAALESELVETEAKEAEAARQERYDTARARADAARETFCNEYPRLARAIVVLLREAAEADVEVLKANADLPADAPALRSIADELWSSRESRVDLEDEEFEIWIRRDDAHRAESALPIPEENVRYIVERDSRAFVERPGVIGHEVVKVKLVRRTYLPEVPMHIRPGLPTVLALPGLPHASAIYEPSFESNAMGVLSAIRKVEERASLVRSGRQPQTEVLTVDQARQRPLKRSA
jgi:hypothetical protein